MMALAPVLQIRRILIRRSADDISLGYLYILLPGFMLWVAYGWVGREPVIAIPNAIALLVYMVIMVLCLRLRRRKKEPNQLS